MEGPCQKQAERLRAANLRPTRQRLGLARLLFTKGGRHVTAERLHAEAVESGLRVSLATIYNTLHQFTAAGLLREIIVEAGRAYFDTNTHIHHHFFFEATGRLKDIPGGAVAVSGLPAPPRGTEIARIDVVVRVR
jgi:Fur family iron response transcriptional regulator